MSICPKTERLCVDDVCRATGSCASSRGRLPTIEICQECKQLDEFCICEDDHPDCYSCDDVGCHECCPNIPRQNQVGNKGLVNE